MKTRRFCARVSTVLLGATVILCVGAYDESAAFVIDPVLTYSSYLGGASYDEGIAIAIDAAGNMYVAGNTYSADFPTSAGVARSSYGGWQDVFVTKITAQGYAYSTYLGGSDAEWSSSIAVDDSGHAYVSGFTFATDFPTTAGAPKLSKSDGADDLDGFVAKLSPTGALDFSTYIGGTGYDAAVDVAVDDSGGIHVTGYSYSRDFPTTADAYQYGNAGLGDAFLVKFLPVAPPGSPSYAVASATLLGGGGTDIGDGVAVDASGSVYLSGQTYSTNFPTVNASQPSNAGRADAFVTKFDASLAIPVYSTYVGGSGNDFGFGIAVDGSGDGFVVGRTTSTDFPPLAIDPLLAARPADDGDVFVAKLDPSGARAYTTRLGGGGIDSSFRVAVDAEGSAWVAGTTTSTDFPTTVTAVQPSYGGGEADAFVAELTPNGAIVYATYVGGSDLDAGTGIATSTEATVVTGVTNSENFPTTGNALRRSKAPAADAFLLKFSKMADTPCLALPSPLGEICP